MRFLVDIVRYSTPSISFSNMVLNDTTQDLYIPINWHGSALAAVAARKADGTILKEDWCVVPRYMHLVILTRLEDSMAPSAATRLYKLVRQLLPSTILPGH